MSFSHFYLVYCIKNNVKIKNIIIGLAAEPLSVARQILVAPTALSFLKTNEPSFSEEKNCLSAALDG